MTMSDSTPETGRYGRFLEWVNENQWRAHTFLVVVVLFYAALFFETIIGSYMFAHLGGDRLFDFVDEYLPVVTSTLVTGEVLDGGTLLSEFAPIPYFLIALAIVVFGSVLQDKFTTSERVLDEDGRIQIRQTGPDFVAWGIILLGFVVPALTGFVIGFW
jgi:hypothetical protein